MADTTNETGSKKEPVKTPNIPRADADLRDIAESASAKWHDTPALTLIWMTQPNFDHLVTTFKDILGSRISTGSTRSEFTGKLKDADKRINAGASHIKDYLIGKYGRKMAFTYYSAFGIVRMGKAFKISPDHDNRKDALELILAALTVHGFDSFEYGHDYWTNVQTDFLEALAKTKGIDGDVSSKVGSKNDLKKQIRKVLNALINLLKANYPDTYKNEMRNWGFQKEKY